MLTKSYILKMEEKKKERLSIEHINKEIFRGTIERVVAYFILVPFFVLLWLCVRGLAQSNDVVVLVVNVVFTIFSCVMAVALVESVISAFGIKKGKYTLSIKKDIVVDKQEYKKRTRYSAGQPYALFFERYGKYVLGGPLSIHYKWSKKNSMTGREVFESSHLGEEFIVLFKKENQILLACNTKFFEHPDAVLESIDSNAQNVNYRKKLFWMPVFKVVMTAGPVLLLTFGMLGEGGILTENLAGTLMLSCALMLGSIMVAGLVVVIIETFLEYFGKVKFWETAKHRTLVIGIFLAGLVIGILLAATLWTSF